MEQLLQFARGPLFIMTFMFMMLGLLRLLVSQFVYMTGIISRAEGSDSPVEKAGISATGWFEPVRQLLKARPLFAIASIIWHIILIITPLLLVNHVMLWNRGLGINFPLALTLNRNVATALTVITIGLTLLLLIFRIGSKALREKSEPADFFLLILLAVPFVTGFFAGHPTISPMSYNSIMFLHILSAETIFVLIPLTKLAHAALWPFGSLSTYSYWVFPGVGVGKDSGELIGEEAGI